MTLTKVKNFHLKKVFYSLIFAYRALFRVEKALKLNYKNGAP